MPERAFFYLALFIIKNNGIIRSKTNKTTLKNAKNRRNPPLLAFFIGQNRAPGPFSGQSWTPSLSLLFAAGQTEPRFGTTTNQKQISVLCINLMSG